MQLSILIAISLAVFYAWFYFGGGAILILKIIVELKRRRRLHIIATEGPKAAEVLFSQLEVVAKKRRISRKTMAEFRNRYFDKISHEEGWKIADERLGPPTFSERTF